MRKGDQIKTSFLKKYDFKQNILNIPSDGIKYLSNAGGKLTINPILYYFARQILYFLIDVIAAHLSGSAFIFGII